MARGRVKLKLTGAESVAELGKALKAAGNGELRKELYSGLNRAAIPMKAALEASARSSGLPAGGGRGRRRTRLVRTGVKYVNTTGISSIPGGGIPFVTRQRVTIAGEKGLKAGDSVADRVAAARFVVKVMTGSRSPRVQLWARPKGGKTIDLKSLDAGRLRHPLFGNKSHWYEQRVAPGWFTRPVEATRDGVRRETLAAVDAVKRKIIT